MNFQEAKEIKETKAKLIEEKKNLWELKRTFGRVLTLSEQENQYQLLRKNGYSEAVEALEQDEKIGMAYFTAQEDTDNRLKEIATKLNALPYIPRSIHEKYFK